MKLDSLETPLRPVEQPDKRPPWKAEGRTMQEQLSRRQVWGADHQGCVIDQFEVSTLGAMPITLQNSQNNRRAFSRG